MVEEAFIWFFRAFGFAMIGAGIWYITGAPWVRVGTLRERLWANTRTVAVFIASLFVAWIYLTFNLVN